MLVAVILGTGVLVLAEHRFPFRRQALVRRGLGRDLGFFYLNMLVMGVLLGMLSGWMSRHGFTLPVPMLGSLHRGPIAVRILAYLLVTDFLHFVTHYFLHRVDWLWRIHRVHHRVQLLDWAATFHIHPAEMVIDRVVLLLAYCLLGFSPEAIVIGYSIEFLWSEFTHANLKLPVTVFDRFLVLPRMHRWHHAFLHETGGRAVNFGTIFTCWDILFKTALIPPGPPARIGFESMETFPETVWDEVFGSFNWTPDSTAKY